MLHERVHKTHQTDEQVHDVKRTANRFSPFSNIEFPKMSIRQQYILIVDRVSVKQALRFVIKI